MCSEMWAYEMITVLAGLFGTTEQAAYIITVACSSVFFEVPLGTAEASCALIGNCIGAGNVPLARRFYKLTAIVAMCEAITLAILTFFGRRAIAEFYSTNLAVQEMAAKLLMINSFTFFCDALQGYL